MRGHDADVAEMFVDGMRKYGAFTPEFLTELIARLGCVPHNRAIGLHRCLRLAFPVDDATLDRLYAEIGNNAGRMCHLAMAPVARQLRDLHVPTGGQDFGPKGRRTVLFPFLPVCLHPKAL